MKKYIIAGIIIYILGTAIVTGLEFINPITAKDVFQIMLLMALIAGIGQVKKDKNKKHKLKCWKQELTHSGTK